MYKVLGGFNYKAKDLIYKNCLLYTLSFRRFSFQLRWRKPNESI